MAAACETVPYGTNVPASAVVGGSGVAQGVLRRSAVAAVASFAVGVRISALLASVRAYPTGAPAVEDVVAVAAARARDRALPRAKSYAVARASGSRLRSSVARRRTTTATDAPAAEVAVARQGGDIAALRLGGSTASSSAEPVGVAVGAARVE